MHGNGPRVIGCVIVTEGDSTGNRTAACTGRLESNAGASSKDRVDLFSGNDLTGDGCSRSEKSDCPLTID